MEMEDIEEKREEDKDDEEREEDDEEEEEEIEEEEEEDQQMRLFGGNYQMQDIKQYDDNSIDPELANKLNYIYRDFGKDAELEKVEKQNQFWKYRKIFMDIERDQVKENKKIRDHRKRVQHLKLVKEKERKATEKMITQFPEKPLREKQAENISVIKGIDEVEENKDVLR